MKALIKFVEKLLGLKKYKSKEEAIKLKSTYTPEGWCGDWNLGSGDIKNLEK